MKIIYFVRHGQSEANVGNYSHGDNASPLTGRGREQALLIADRCTRLPIDVIIASSMQRAQETAQLIAKKTGHALELSDTFIERRMPSAIESGMMGEMQIRKNYMRWVKTLYVEDDRYEDGENFSDIRRRARTALTYLEGRPENNILIVTHGFFLKVLLASVLFGESVTSDELKRAVLYVKMENTGITALNFESGQTKEYDGMPVEGWSLRTWNDHAHLG